MTKNQKIILFGAIAIFLALTALIIVLIVKNDEHTQDVNQIQEQMDSLRRQNDSLELAHLTTEFDRLNAEYLQIDDKAVEEAIAKSEIKNDSLVRQYNNAKQKINSLIKELEQEKKAHNVDIGKIRQLESKIKELQSEIGTLKDIARHYLEEINRLNTENQGLRTEIATEKTRNETLERENQTVTQSNAQLTQTVQLAKKLNIASLNLYGINKKDKDEKSFTKSKKLGVSFSVTPNNTAAPGMKTFYVRIISPEGNLLGGGPSFTYDGASLTSTAARQMEYDNQELPVSIFWDVNTTLTPGTYKVEVFADGYRLGSKSFNMAK